MPYLLSTWTRRPGAGNVPEMVYPEALILGMREVGARSTLNLWGNVYPRGGFLHQTDDHKAGAVVAQRAGDVVTRRGQIHVYQPLLANSRMATGLAGALMEGDASTGKWQELTPVLSSSCTVFPRNGFPGTGPTRRLRLGVVGGPMRAANAGARCSSAASISIEGTAMKRPELMNPSAKVRRPLRPTALAGALALVCGLAWAQAGFQTSGPVIGDEVMYSIGGGVRCPWAAPLACVRSGSAWAGTATSSAAT